MIADHPVDAGTCADNADDFAGGSSALLRKGCFLRMVFGSLRASKGMYNSLLVDIESVICVLGVLPCCRISVRFFL